MYAAELHALEYELETNWAEPSTSFATQNVPLIAPVDISKVDQQMLEPSFVAQRLQEGYPKIPGPQGGSITTRFHIPGHGTNTSGAMAASALATLLGHAYGKHTTGPAGDTITGGTKAVPTTTSSATFPRGLARIGTGGLAADGRGNGAWVAIGDHTGHNLTLLTELDANPANADVLYSADHLYLPEAASDNVVKSIRLRWVTAGLQYSAHGCYATAIRKGGTGAGETPWTEVDWGVSRWEPVTDATYPSAVTSTKNQPAPIGGGGLFVAAVGTATRDATTKRNARDFTVEIDLGVKPLPGWNGVSPVQTIVGALRTPSKIKISWMEEADAAATLTPYLDSIWGSATARHVLFEGSRTPGSAFAMYFRHCCPSGKRPVPVNDNGIWRVRIELMAYAGSDTTDALSQAAMIVALG